MSSDDGGRLRENRKEDQHDAVAGANRPDGDDASPTPGEVVRAALEKCPDEKLVSAEILVQLLRIQAKYLDDHPCLCTSRFRHTLHLLDQDQHRKLASLCGTLQKITSTSSSHLYETTLHYGSIVSKIFEYEALVHSSSLLAAASGGEARGGCVCHGQGGDHDREEAKTTDSSQLGKRLEAILARLVSDYRAIFAIEEENYNRSDHHGSHGGGGSAGDGADGGILLHPEPRKRHEEEDECPEEIKLMKVAWEEFTLDCRFTNSAAAAALGSAATRHGGLNNNSESRAAVAAVCQNRDQEPTQSQQEEERNSCQKCGDSTTTTSTATRPSSSSSATQHPRKRKERQSSESGGQGDRQPGSSSLKFSRHAADDDDQGQDSSELWECGGVGSSSQHVLQELSCDCEASSASSGCGVGDAAARTASSSTRRPRKERSDSLKENKTDDDEEQDKLHSVTSAVQVKVDTTSADDLRSRLSRSSSTSSSSSSPCCNDPPLGADDGVGVDGGLGSSVTTTASTDDDGDNSSSVDSSSPRSNADSDSQKKSLCVSLSAPPVPDHLGHHLPSVAVPITANHHHLHHHHRDRDHDSPVRSWDLLQQLDQRDQSHQPLSWMPASLRRDSSSQSSEDGGGSVDDFPSSTRAFGMLNSQRYLDPTHMAVSSQRRASDPEALRRGKLKQLKRQLSNLRRKMEDLETEYQSSHGYRPSQADKQGNKQMRKILTEQTALKRQIRGYRDSDSFIPLPTLEQVSSSTDDRIKEQPAASVSPVAAATAGSSPRRRGSNSELTMILNDGKDSPLMFAHDDDDEDNVSNSALDTTTYDHGSVGYGVDNNNSASSCDLESLRDSLRDVEAQLRAQRVMKGRPADPEDMTAEQLAAEKADLQSAILTLEHTFGAMDSTEERVILRDVTERYRTVRRLVRRSSASRNKDSLAELETIPEDEAIDLTLASPQHRINIEVGSAASSASSPSPASASEPAVSDLTPPSSTAKEGGFLRLRCQKKVEVEEDVKLEEEEANEDDEAGSDCFDAASSGSACVDPDGGGADPDGSATSLHSLSRYELLTLQRRTREEKRRHRRAIREREERIQRETGRRLVREERDRSESVYQQYKNSKAKLKLIDALLSKRVDHQFF